VTRPFAPLQSRPDPTRGAAPASPRDPARVTCPFVRRSAGHVYVGAAEAAITAVRSVDPLGFAVLVAVLIFFFLLGGRREW
jgi:hypothetical protein